MTIAERDGLDKSGAGERLARLVRTIPRPILLLSLILLTSSATFAVGRLYEREEGTNADGQGNGLWIENLPTSEVPAAAAAVEGAGTAPHAASVPVKPVSHPSTVSASTSVPRATSTLPVIPAGGEVIGSKNGGSYYLPWCSGVKRISPGNLVTFASKEAAEAKGYKPAKNCKGL